MLLKALGVLVVGIISATNGAGKGSLRRLPSYGNLDFEDGWYSGYSKGKGDGKGQMFQEAFVKGRQKGGNAGYDDGFTDGYHTGYVEGQEQYQVIAELREELKRAVLEITDLRLLLENTEKVIIQN